MTSTTKDWLSVSSEITGLVNEWSLRGDLVAVASPIHSLTAPAQFSPSLAEIEINTTSVFGEYAQPHHVAGISERGLQFEFPEGTGAIYHEALHARYSRWDMKLASEALTKAEFDAMTLLEESRIEARGVIDVPKNAIFLRASALKLVASNLDESLASLSSVEQAGRLAGLLLSRIDAGVVYASDVSKAYDTIEGILGADTLSELRAVWVKFQEFTSVANIDPMYDLAREWVRILSKKSEEMGEQSEESKQEVFQVLSDAVGEAQEESSIGIAQEVAEQQRSEEWAEVVRESQGKAETQREHKNVAQKIFSSAHTESGTGSRSRIVEKRPPTGQERASAVKIAKLLEKAKYRERSQTEISSVVPPGRLRTRSLVQGQALKSKGVNQQVESWRRTVRKHTEDPKLTIGVMVDISGSMSMAMTPMAVSAWVLSEVGRRVQADTAMVYYGSGVFPTLKRGQHLPEVNIYSAPDATEKFDEAFKALNGELNLLSGSGARLLVIASDGQYTLRESLACREWLKRATASGVAVVWLSYDSGAGHITKLLKNPKVQVVNVAPDFTESADVIGKASAEALERATAGI